jgi:L-amino acid N-acyltransferase YncA
VIRIRAATQADAAALREIYRPYVERTAISFEAEVPSVEEFAGRIAKYAKGWDWVVAEEDGTCLGYAYGSAHRERAAYRWSVETSVYVHENHQRRGIATAAYAELLERLTVKGYCNAFAGIALPNDASVALHQRLGFEMIGVFRRVGRKFDRWHDVAWLQRRLRDEPPAQS